MLTFIEKKFVSIDGYTSGLTRELEKGTCECKAIRHLYVLITLYAIIIYIFIDCTVHSWINRMCHMFMCVLCLCLIIDDRIQKHYYLESSA